MLPIHSYFGNLDLLEGQGVVDQQKLVFINSFLVKKNLSLEEIKSVRNPLVIRDNVERYCTEVLDQLRHCITAILKKEKTKEIFLMEPICQYLVPLVRVGVSNYLHERDPKNLEKALRMISSIAFIEYLQDFLFASLPSQLIFYDPTYYTKKKFTPPILKYYFEPNKEDIFQILEMIKEEYRKERRNERCIIVSCMKVCERVFFIHASIIREIFSSHFQLQ